MIDPFNITDFNRTKEELEEFFLFSIAVAGKKATSICKKVDEFLSDKGNFSPFGYIKYLLAQDKLMERLIDIKYGQYQKNYESMKSIIDLDLDLSKDNREKILKVHGVGPKTANFFLMHSRKGWIGAALDVHILKYMRSKGIDTPINTPSGKLYETLENKFIELWKQDAPHLSIAQFDLDIWSFYARGGKGELVF